MKKTSYIFLCIIILCISTCKKATTITVKVFNPALNEYVAGAVVVLTATKESKGFLSGNSECEEIATAMTDANRIAIFTNEKLRKNSKYKYKVGIKESWGITHQNFCGSQTQRYLEIGKSQEVLLTDYLDTEINFQYNNVFAPGATGDSLICDIYQMLFYDPVIGHTQGGGGIEGVTVDFNTFYPLPNPTYTQTIKTFANRMIVKLRKRKLGVVTSTIDTVRIRPSKTVTTIQINW